MLNLTSVLNFLNFFITFSMMSPLSQGQIIVFPHEQAIFKSANRWAVTTVLVAGKVTLPKLHFQE